jgi:hypothetical protein
MTRNSIRKKIRVPFPEPNLCLRSNFPDSLMATEMSEARVGGSDEEDDDDTGGPAAKRARKKYSKVPDEILA